MCQGLHEAGALKSSQRGHYCCAGFSLGRIHLGRGCRPSNIRFVFAIMRWRDEAESTHFEAIEWAYQDLMGSSVVTASQVLGVQDPRLARVPNAWREAELVLWVDEEEK